MPRKQKNPGALREWLVGGSGILSIAATLIIAFFAVPRHESSSAPAAPPASDTGPSSISPHKEPVVGPGATDESRQKSQQSRSKARAFPLDDYIDRNVHRIAGSLNVAVAIQGLPSSSSVAAALRRALSGRGMAELPLFKEKFRQDGTAQRLFAGSAALAGDLKLREFVDSVLLAEFRFVGPAQAVEGGLFIREAVLEVHAIDPSSGEVRKIQEIREKGGGATAELSSENAVTRLEEAVEGNISEWIWV
jgi:hypothetical protein